MKWGEKDNQKEEQNFMFDKKEILASQERGKKGVQNNSSLCDMKYYWFSSRVPEENRDCEQKKQN